MADGGGRFWASALALIHTALALSSEESKVFMLQTGAYDQPSTEVFLRYNFSSVAPTARPLEHLTVCYRFWISKYRGQINPFFSYAYSDKADNALLFFQATDSIGFYYNDKKESSDVLKVDDTLETWHHHCFVFAHPTYRFYVDGSLMMEGTLESEASPIPLNGTLYLGQEQDTFDGGLDPYQSFSGYLSQVSIWDYDLSPSTVRDMAGCSLNPRGNVLSSDTTPLEESRVETQVAHMGTFCTSRERFVIIPVMMYPREAQAFCRLVDSRFYVPRGEEDNTRLYEEGRQFAEACSGKSYRFLFLGATDEGEEGRWTGLADGLPLSYTAWGPGEPNGGDKRNCLVLRKHDDRWGDVQCDDRLCFSCGRGHGDYLQLRGLCQEREHETRFLLDGYINGRPFFRGYYGTLIHHSGASEWLLWDSNATLAVLPPQLPPADFPIGRRAWRVATPFCGHPEGSQVLLGLSACATGDFMCSDGTCAPRAARCNLRDDCSDGSDEEGCSVVVFSGRYNNRRPPPGDTPDAPLSLRPTVDLVRFSRIDDIDLAFHMEVEVALSWTDGNLRYRNLEGEEGKNKLSDKEAKRIWTPEVEFLNVNDGKLKLLKSGVYVRRTGQPDPPVFTDVQMDTIYQSSSGKLVQRRQYYASFNCNFGLFKYPFDTQTCHILIKLSTADTNVLSLKNASVLYSGNSQLPKYSLQNIDIFVKTRSGYGVLEVVFEMERRWSLLMLTIFMPTFLLLGIGYGTLYIKLVAFQVRAIMTLTTLLVLYTLFNQVSSALPNTAYIKMIDQWFFFCIFLIFSIIVIHIWVENLGRETPKPRKVLVSPAEGQETRLKPGLFVITVSAERVLFVCRRVVYPVITFVFCLVFWIVILSVT